MPWTYYYLPQLAKVTADKQMAANLKGSISRFADGREVMFRSLLDIQKENIAKEKHRLEFMLPSFAKARANLMAPFENLRNAVAGEWQVVPEGKFRKSGPLVFWPFKFTYRGSAAQAIQALAHLETSTQFMLLRDYSILRSDGQVEMTGLVELVFQNNGEDEFSAGGTL